MRVYMCVCTYMYVCVCMRACLWICMHVCMCVCTVCGYVRYMYVQYMLVWVCIYVGMYGIYMYSVRMDARTCVR